MITVYGPSGAVGSTTGTGSPDGSYTATAPISPPQPEGTSLYVTVMVGITVTGPAEPCYGGGGGGGGDGGGSGEAENPAEFWPGYSDGRLNPDPGEYYSVWCSYDQIQVWRAVPTSQLLTTFPLLSVFRLAEGGTLSGGNAILTRDTADTITISGFNGNLAPAWGSKAFSLSECIARNGGVPEEPEPPGGEVGSPPEGDQGDTTDTEVCLSLENEQDALDCLFSLGDLSSLQILFLWIWQLCFAAPGIVLVPAGILGWRRHRRNALDRR
jgi:hypothetical protein